MRRTAAATHIDFQKTWLDYANGFGDLNSEFWLGRTLMSLAAPNIATCAHTRYISIQMDAQCTDTVQY